MPVEQMLKIPVIHASSQAPSPDLMIVLICFLSFFSLSPFPTKPPALAEVSITAQIPCKFHPGFYSLPFYTNLSITEDEPFLETALSLPKYEVALSWDGGGMLLPPENPAVPTQPATHMKLPGSSSIPLSHSLPLQPTTMVPFHWSYREILEPPCMKSPQLTLHLLNNHLKNPKRLRTDGKEISYRLSLIISL